MAGASELNRKAAQSRWFKHNEALGYRTVRRPTPVVYSLSDPRTGEVKYIGATANPAARKRSHQRFQSIRHRSKNVKLAEWVKLLMDNGLVPVWSVIRETNLRDMYKHEREEIAKRKDLLNIISA